MKLIKGAFQGLVLGMAGCNFATHPVLFIILMMTLIVLDMTFTKEGL